MQVPRLPVTGENFKKYAIDTLKAIIAYLHASRVRPGKGIRVEETPCGTVISIIPRGSAIQGGAGGITYDAGTGITITGGTPGVPEKINANITGGNAISVTGGTNGNPLVIAYTGSGGGATGIYSNVSTGYATIHLSGGTGSVTFRGAIYNDDGDIVITGGTGTQPPVWSNSGHYAVLERGNVPYTVPGDGWLYAFANVKVSGTGLNGKYGAHVSVNGGEFKVCEIEADSHTFYGSSGNIGVGSGIVIPVKSGSTVSWRINEYSGSDGVAAVTVGMVYYRIS